MGITGTLGGARCPLSLSLPRAVPHQCAAFKTPRVTGSSRPGVLVRVARSLTHASSAAQCHIANDAALDTPTVTKDGSVARIRANLYPERTNS